MRILCLTSRLPYPPYGGDRLRTFNLINRLSREHEVSLVSFIAAPSERDHLTQLRSLCQNVRVILMSPFHSAVSVLRNIWRRKPMQTLYYRSKAMHRAVAEMLSATRFDVVYVHLFRMAPYIANYAQLYRIVDLTDVISREIGYSLRYRRGISWLIYRLEQPRIAQYERWVAHNVEEIWMISEAERQVLAAACPGTPIHIVTNGVDTTLYRPTGQPCDPNSLLFVGNLHAFHNEDAAVHLVHDILPIVRRQIPDCRINIVGINAGARIWKLTNVSGVSVTGFVPDLNDFLNRSVVFVAPLRAAAGIQNKVLEAMAAGRPVVTTSLVNTGLGAHPDRDLLIADDAETTANQVITLLRDEQLRIRIGRAGRQFVQRMFTWDSVAERMRTIETILPKTYRKG